MTDTRGEECGIHPVQIRGWPKWACRVHDRYYAKDSWAQLNLTRSEADQAFLNMLLNSSRQGSYRRLKKVASYTMYGISRLLGWMWWEGRR